MIRSFLLAGTVLAVALPAAATAQGTRRGSCASTSMSSYQDWFAIAAGVTCSATETAQAEDLSNGLMGGVSFYVSGPWDPVGFAPPSNSNSNNSNNNNNSSNNNNNSNSNNTNTPNLGCSPYVAKPWDPPGPPPAPCNNNNNTDPGTDETPTPPTDEVNLNTLVNEPNATPEPATLLLVASGLGGVGALARRRKAARNAKES